VDQVLTSEVMVKADACVCKRAQLIAVGQPLRSAAALQLTKVPSIVALVRHKRAWIGGTAAAFCNRWPAVAPAIATAIATTATSAAAAAAATATVTTHAVTAAATAATRSFTNVPYLLSVDGAEAAEAELVFPAGVERSHLNDSFQTVNWLRYRVGRPISVPMRLGQLYFLKYLVQHFFADFLVQYFLGAIAQHVVCVGGKGRFWYHLVH
jgi:hypothetical protein